ncbi:MAG: fumarylacetoacetase [Flavobacteriaceae bacterium]|nr:fumarylacetoacetase [Flavobacteriaceae bacterium]|tara:strand:+ start:5982 stop:7220 length:1239 start_codon:yes stop_codon:yes gene_type:complete
MNTWIEIPKNSDFSIYNLPFGIFSTNKNSKRVGIAIGNNIIDLLACNELDIFKDLNINNNVFENNFLNDFINLGKNKTNKVREIIQQQLTDESSKIKMSSIVIIPMNETEMHLPVKVGDYTDFYSSIEHATNIGSMFRDPSNPLLPNWRHLPVGYHGRASSIIVSGIDIFRPQGQVMPVDSDKPVFTSSKRIDFELEMGYIIGKKSSLGSSIKTDDADNYIFGKVLFNDWSARDIQKWEYVPLGPFLGKSFASSISPWVVTIEALDNFRVAGPIQNPEVLDYLKFNGLKNYDINLSVSILPEETNIETIVCKSNFKYMYWNMSQQIAHHTINGCNLNVGDMMASGTISGKSKDSYGSMLELSWGGKKNIELNDGSSRTFIEDYDSVIIRGYCEKDNIRVGFGEVKSKLLPSI